MEARSSAAQSDRAFAIVGPTAVGKSAVGLLLAEQLSGEIISVDSMQVYRGLDIGTAKPSAEETKRVPHHLIDVVGLEEAFDAAKFCELATAAEQEILSRKKTPIFCGGTGLYLKAYLGGLGEAPPADERVRNELNALSLPELLRELETKDPVTFARIDKNNPRRVIRAVEVIRLTGKPYSEQRSDWKESAPDKQTIFGLQLESAELRACIDRRVDQMFAQGLVAETQHLLECGLEQNRTAMQSIGYRQVVEHLRGERSFAETIELVKIKTRQFAKRQMTWFRRQLDVTWIPATSTEQVAATIIQKLKSS